MLRFKRILITLAVLSAFIPAAHSQLRYGFRFGGSFADARLSRAEDFSLSNKSGFSGGVMLEYQMPKCGVAFDIALLYTRFSTTLLHNGERAGDFGRDFIEMPIHAKYKFRLHFSNGLIAPMVYTGPSFMTRLNHGGTCPMSTNSLQSGWDFGVGFDVINFIQITGGYRLGLDNSIYEFGHCPDAKYHVNGWNISANLIFDF